jgi:hypothetical protein
VPSLDQERGIPEPLDALSVQAYGTHRRTTGDPTPGGGVPEVPGRADCVLSRPPAGVPRDPGIGPFEWWRAYPALAPLKHEKYACLKRVKARIFVLLDAAGCEPSRPGF